MSLLTCGRMMNDKGRSSLCYFCLYCSLFCFLLSLSWIKMCSSVFMELTISMSKEFIILQHKVLLYIY
ncbi:unnamed protein product [Brassica rapa subsp. trilocularis]